MVSRATVGPRQFAIFVLAVGVGGLLAYYPSLDNFFRDDDLWRLNHASKIPSDPLLALRENTPYLRPIGNLYFTAVYPVFRVKPAAYRLAALGLHVLNVTLLALLALRLMRNRLSACLAGAVFGVAWVHYEVIYWVSAINDLIAAAFVLGALLCYLRYLEAGRRSAYAASLALAVGSLMSKESAVVLPLLILLLHIVKRRSGLWRLLPFLALAAALAGLEHGLGLLARHGPKRGIGLHMLTNLAGYARHVAMEPLAPWPWVQPVAAGALLVPPLTRHSTRRVAGFGAAWLLVGLLPATQWRYMELQSRWCYLSSAGLGLWLGAWGLRLRAASARERAVVILVLTSLTGHNVVAVHMMDRLERIQLAQRQQGLISSIRAWVQPATRRVVISGCVELPEWQVEAISELYFNGRLVKDDEFPIQPGRRASARDTVVLACHGNGVILK